MKVIRLSGVCEKYKIKFIRNRNVSWEEISALKDINFEVNQGEVLGIIGQNGAGKTTLLRLIAGMLRPDEGEVKVNGRVSVIMELGAGFNREFTGRENIRINAQAYGLDKAKINKDMESIIEFANLGKFIDAPVKYYSQGMYMRLTFALAISVDPDILLIDDILAVGDQQAQQKCVDKIYELKKSGKTIIVVSHDMNMVRQLCSRVIFLNKGRIVQKGSIYEVIPKYIETTGNREGIADIENSNLKVIFNNGKLIIKYNGMAFTKGSGGHVAWLVPSFNKPIHSFSLHWTVNMSTPKKIVAENFDKDGNLFQCWMIEIKDGYLEWRVNVKKDFLGQRYYLNLCLLSGYKHWMSLSKQGDFGKFIHETEWQTVDSGDKDDNLILVKGDKVDNYFPVLMIRSGLGDNFIIFNSGYTQEERIISFLSSSSDQMLLRIRLWPEQKEAENYLSRMQERLFRKKQEKAKELENKKNENKEIRRNSNIISLNDMSVLVDSEFKALKLYYKNNEITSGAGLHSDFNVYNGVVWLPSQNISWKIVKKSKEEIILFCDYKEVDLCQVWEIKFSSLGVLDIEIYIEVNETVRLANYDLGLEIQDEFNEWKTVYEQGVFPRSQSLSGVIPVRLENSRISMVKLKAIDKYVYPDISIISSLGNENLNMGICKKIDCRGDNRICVNSSFVVLGKERLFKPGRYKLFKGKIVFGGNIKLEQNISQESTAKIGKGNLNCIFNNGRGNVFWKNKKLTSGLGLYTSLRHSGVWNDSGQAIWKIKFVDDCKIIAVSDWVHIPVSQIWEIEIIDDNKITWKISEEIYEMTNIEIEQANIMLSNEYRNWNSLKLAKGKFLDDYTKQYDILPFRYWSGKSGGISVSANGLPNVTFKNILNEEEHSLIIENSDDLYKARILQYQRAGGLNIAPGKYLYFQGEVVISKNWSFI